MNRTERRAASKHTRQAFAEAVRLHQAGRLKEAHAVCQQLLRADPNDINALHLTGIIASDVGLEDVAVSVLSRAIALNGAIPALHHNLAETLRRFGHPEQAAAPCRRALALAPDFAPAWATLGNLLLLQGDLGEAVAAFRRALALAPGQPAVHNNLGTALSWQGRLEEAAAAFAQALAIDPGYAQALYNRGDTLRELGRYPEAAADFEKLLAVAPDHDYAAGALLHARLYCCDWRHYGEAAAAIVAAAAVGRRAAIPPVLHAVGNAPAAELAAAQTYCRDKYEGPGTAPAWRGDRYRHDRIRVAYLSADFGHHAVGYSMVNLFEGHDRSRFSTTAISFGPGSPDAFGSRLEDAFDRFIDVRDKSDRAAARLLSELEIDIAVDLMGYTAGCRPGILAARGAPVQVSYIGYPGTTGSGFIDYAIVDRYIVPPDRQQFYSERLVYLPHCYQPSDPKRKPGRRPTREECNLPPAGFVFCCFNSVYKIVPETFAVWMRLLGAAPGSVLWLAEPSAPAAGSLRAAAAAGGVDPERIVFAPRAAMADYLARYEIADLFLDTFPYNAGATANDALWAGLPVLTRSGETYVGRMAASLLHAVGLPELVTDSAAAYEACALRLATEPNVLTELRRRLAQNRLTTPLFDMASLTRQVESAYAQMWEISQRGGPPTGFAVAADPP